MSCAEDWACCLLMMAACNESLRLRDEAGHRAGVDYIGRAFMQTTECSAMAKDSEFDKSR